MIDKLRHLETFARAGWFARGVVCCLLTHAAIRLATGQAGSSGSDREQAAAGMMFDLPLCQTVLGVVGLCFLAAAAHQATKAWTTEFMKGVAAGAPEWAVPVGRAGLAARAVVFAVIGISLVRAGWFGAAGEVKGLGDALSSLNNNPELYLLAAFGLFLFGVHSFVEARWRRIRNEDVVSRLKAKVGRAQVINLFALAWHHAMIGQDATKLISKDQLYCLP